MIINKQSLEEQATDYLRDKIVNGEMEQGEKIVESTLAKDLELSRSTVRMALNTLSHEGLVVQKPYAGWHVFMLDENDLWELYNIRVALESQAASMAAEKASEQDKKALSALFQEYCDLCATVPDDIKAISQADFKLHRKIVEVSCSKRMEKAYSQIANQLLSYLSMTHIDYDLSQSALSHKPMIDAICDGNAELAWQEAKANITPVTPLCDSIKNHQA
ncbi:GntR family transcriptional regulator [Vibrio ichthyoenteri ATCC 700023]|uniref:GntR family transcriptional regulator n=1 Tax=Vibrio ichthyoenteri ATCC 700023 TaxID=870968 RepID=F9S027_9VIBR|nr:GntR family transcriptional regulator [Vibrio ichthyoenteri]EGU43917.1 GntR family transcriptional regulator [Vibrio ichthyoenteri ATCC 700023]